MLLVDSHCHLNLLAEKHDLRDVITRAHASGVELMQTICTKLADLPTLIKITEEFESVYASVGIHPNDVTELAGYEKLIDLTKHDKIIGLGETGLDYYYKHVSREIQIDCFIDHIRASQSTKLPVIIHTRDAEVDTIDILKSEMHSASFPALIHCFTSNIDFARQVLDLGLYISIAGIVTFKNAESLKEVTRFVPLDRLLIETDSPYLTPVPFRGKQNEPAYVLQVAQYIADLKNISLSKVAEATTDNFFSLFSKCRRKNV